MVYNKYTATNNAQSLLLAWISNGSLTMQVTAWEWALFPSTYPFLLVLEQYNTDAVPKVVKREIVKVTNRSTDTLTIVRSAWSCVQDDTANPRLLWTTAYSFDAWDSVSLYVTAEDSKDVKDEVSRLETAKLNVADFQNGTPVYWASSWGTDDYEITLVPAISWYALWQCFRFQADVWNTGPATLNVNSKWPITIKKLHDQDLETGDIEAGQIVEVAYDWTYFQMDSQVAIIQEAETSKLTENIDPVWEDWDAWDCLFNETAPTFAESTSKQNIWDIASNTRIAFPVFWSGVAWTTLKLWLCKTSSPSDNLKLRIETDNAGEPSGTLFDANAISSIEAASLTTSLADTTMTLAGSITIPKWQRCRVVLYVWDYWSETVNWTNYYNVWYINKITTARGIQNWDGATWGSHFLVVDIPTWYTYWTSHSITQSEWWKIQTNVACTLKQVVIKTGDGSTRCRLRDSAGTVLDTQSVTSYIATFNYPLAANTVYRVEADNSGGAYTALYSHDGTQPIVSTNITWITRSQDGVDLVDADVHHIVSITTEGRNPYINYVSSWLFSAWVLSKTNAVHSYQIPNALLRIAKASYVAWTIPKVTMPGSITSAIPWLTANTDIFLSDTPWAVSTTPGTNKYLVGKVLPDWVNVRQCSRNFSTSSITATSSPQTRQNTLSFPISIMITWGTVSKIEISRNWSNYFQVWAATNAQVLLQPLDYLKVTYSSNPTMTIFYE